MNRHLLSRVLALAVSLLLIAAVILGVRYLYRRMNIPTPAEGQQDDMGEVVEALQNGPLMLHVVSSQLGGQSYTSFDVYFVNETNNELLFSCGRQFPAREVASIDWAAESNDIVVSLTNGKQEIFSYDGSTQWN